MTFLKTTWVAGAAAASLGLASATIANAEDAPAAAAAPAPAAQSLPTMTPPLSANTDPASFDTALGKIYVTGQLTALGFTQTNAIAGDHKSLVDLSNAQKPKVAGKLDVPGYSEYLQPIANDLLLGIGRDVSGDGRTDQGLQVSLFDVSNAASPKRTAAFTLADGWGGSSQAEFDHHAFAYFPDQHVLALPVDHYDEPVVDDTTDDVSGGGFRQTLAVLRVDPTKGSGAFQKLGEPEPPGGVTRAVRIADVLYAVGPDHVQSMPLETPDTRLGLVDTGGGGT